MNYGFPVVLPFNKTIPNNSNFFVRYDIYRHRPSPLRGVHLFIDDFRINTTFSNPKKCLPYVRGFQLAVGPDFSVAVDFPHAMNIWNIFKSRWVTRYWQDNGVSVIPPVGWGNFDTFDYAFQSLPEQSTLAVHCDIDDSTNELFIEGYKIMCERLRPSLVLVLGKLPIEVIEFAKFVEFPFTYLGSVTKKCNKKA